MNTKEAQRVNGTCLFNEFYFSIPRCLPPEEHRWALSLEGNEGSQTKAEVPCKASASPERLLFSFSVSQPGRSDHGFTLKS